MLKAVMIVTLFFGAVPFASGSQTTKEEGAFVCRKSLRIKGRGSWLPYLKPLRDFVMETRRPHSDASLVRVGQTDYPVENFLGRSNEGAVYVVRDPRSEAGLTSVKRYVPPVTDGYFREAYMLWSLGRLAAAKVSGIPTIMPGKANIDWTALNSMAKGQPDLEMVATMLGIPEIDWSNLSVKFDYVLGISVQDAVSPVIWNGNSGDSKKDWIPVPAALRVPATIASQIIEEYELWKAHYCAGRLNPVSFNSGDRGRFTCNQSDVLIEFKTEGMKLIDD